MAEAEKVDGQRAVVAAIESGAAGDGRRLRRIDTHMSHVFLGPERVYKLKRSVALGTALLQPSSPRLLAMGACPEAASPPSPAPSLTSFPEPAARASCAPMSSESTLPARPCTLAWATYR
ncbi:hypothetical protein LJR164_003422 [Phenylobacterium sp. LjRoot164]|uniref:hypothetical protein n=1 Tax=unclassified Phenylobacterium TaxID=2640670 RepID=UPI003ECEDF3C